jgi:hypothetical protein
MPTDREIRARYGPDAVISRTRGFVLVHLDRPDPALVAARNAGFDPDEVFEADCPLCQIQRASRTFVYDDFPDDDEWVFLE